MHIGHMQVSWDDTSKSVFAMARLVMIAAAISLAVLWRLGLVRHFMGTVGCSG